METVERESERVERKNKRRFLRVPVPLSLPSSIFSLCFCSICRVDASRRCGRRRDGERREQCRQLRSRDPDQLRHTSWIRKPFRIVLNENQNEPENASCDFQTTTPRDGMTTLFASEHSWLPGSFEMEPCGSSKKLLHTDSLHPVSQVDFKS